MSSGTSSTLPTATSTTGETNEVQGVGRASAKHIERTPPHHPDAEMAVLGSLLIQPDAIGECLEKIGDQGCDYFYDPRHQILFSALKEMYDTRQAIDPLTLQHYLETKHVLDLVGGEVYLHELYGCMATASNVFYYLNIIRDCYLRRRLIEAGSRIVTESFDLRHETVDGLADEADKLIFDITQRRVSMEVISMQQLVQQAMEAVELAHDNKGLLTGLPTGFRELDKLTNGFHEGEMIVVAARPSKGKTALAMNIAEHIGILHGKPVGIFSLEMTSKELGLRMLSSVSKVDSRKMRDGFTNERDHLALTDAASRMRKAPIYIDDTGALTISQLRAKARRMVKQYKIKMIVIDYLQLMHGVTRRQESRAQEVSEISGGIKALAKELKVPILVISQLNRDVEKRPDSKPRLADLRESGAIEQDADVVLLLARGGADEEDEGEQGKSDLVIAKQRNGPTGNVELTFLAHCTRFVDRAKTQD